MANIDRVQGTLGSTVTVDRVQGVSGTLGTKAPCVAATTTAITLAGLQTVDGITLAAGDRVLVKNQTPTSANGVYSASTSDWQRALDFDGAADVVPGGLVFVSAGTVNGQHGFMVQGTAPLVPGTSGITFAQVADFTSASAFGLSLHAAQDAYAGRAILAAAKSGANTDITSLASLPLAIATPSTTQASAATALGAVLNGVAGSLTSARTITTADRGKLLNYTANTFTQPLLAAATAGEGFVLGMRNAGTGAVTLDGNASELIDGAAAIVLTAGEACLLVCDGSGWKTVGLNRQVLQRTYAELRTRQSAVAQIPCDGTIPQIAEGMLVLTQAITPVSANSYLEIEVGIQIANNASQNLVVALFVQGTNDAIAAVVSTIANTWEEMVFFKIKIPSTNISPRTYAVRAGTSSAGYTIYVNGYIDSVGASTNISSMTITEVV